MSQTFLVAALLMFAGMDDAGTNAPFTLAAGLSEEFTLVSSGGQATISLRINQGAGMAFHLDGPGKCDGKAMGLNTVVGDGSILTVKCDLTRGEHKVILRMMSGVAHGYLRVSGATWANDAGA